MEVHRKRYRPSINNEHSAVRALKGGLPHTRQNAAARRSFPFLFFMCEDSLVFLSLIVVRCGHCRTPGALELEPGKGVHSGNYYKLPQIGRMVAIEELS